jgi:hypothetical protein
MALAAFQAFPREPPNDMPAFSTPGAENLRRISLLNQ